MRILKLLWSDQRGAILSGEYVLIATILGLGVIVGLAAVRNALVTELCDMAEGISASDHPHRRHHRKPGHGGPLTAGDVFGHGNHGNGNHGNGHSNGNGNGHNGD